jgi:hypothetical protein
MQVEELGLSTEVQEGEVLQSVTEGDWLIDAPGHTCPSRFNFIGNLQAKERAMPSSLAPIPAWNSKVPWSRQPI